MRTPKVEYNVYEVGEYFKDEINIIEKRLSQDVKDDKIKAEDARKKLDMYLSMMIYIDICIGMAEHEKFMNDKSFSQYAIHAKAEKEASGKNKLRKAFKELQ